MNFDKKYYDILGVEKTASENDIKKAYRKLAAKWHPDKFIGKTEEEQSEAETKMRDINEAYEILSDKNKRQEYDNGPANPFFGGGHWSPFGGFANQGPRFEQGKSVGITLSITWDDILNGKVDRDIEYHKNVRCPKCKGAGGEDVRTCSNCGGSGMYVHTERRGNMIMQQQTICPICGGTGKIVGKHCNECNGHRVIKQKVTEHLELPLEYIVHNGVQINVGGLGGESPDIDGPNGELYIKVKHDFPEGITLRSQFGLESNFTGNSVGVDVIHNMKIPYYDLMLGTKVNIQTPKGKTISVTIPKCTVPGKELRLAKQGIDFNNGVVGNYYVIPEVQIPNKLNKNEEKYLNKIKEIFETDKQD